MYKIIVADDDPLTLLGTETFLTSIKMRVISTHTNGISCLNAILADLPDIAIIDVSMPGMSGLEILSIVKFKNLPVKVILLTRHKELSIYFRAKESGFDGFVLKDHAEIELQACINQVMKGKTFLSQALSEYFVIDNYSTKTKVMSDLTSTEQKVLELVAEQKSNLEIASLLFISEKTVESHKRNICEKLELPKGKNMLLKWAIAHVKK
jgi:two-component system, NarL family, nitrate/nitrite response regulator NarL